MKLLITNILLLSCVLSQLVVAQNDIISNPDIPLLTGAQGTCNTCPSGSRDGDGFLASTYNNTQCGLNYVQASVMVTLRYTPNPGVGFPCTLNISGIPSCVNVEQAYLYWAASAPTDIPQFTITNPNNVTDNYSATLIGTCPDKCWGQTFTRNYRGDVTASIAGNGNYEINCSMGDYAVDGVTLLIIYTDPMANYEGSLIIDDGCIVRTGGGTENHTITGFAACDSSSVATSWLIVSDMQDNISATHPTTCNSTSGTYPNAFYNFDEAQITSVTNGQNNSFFSTTGMGGDCFDVVATGLYYQTTACTNCGNNSGNLTSVTSSQDDLCGNCNGQATITPSGGSTPYTYQWDSNTGSQTSQTATGLCAGTYIVTVNDAGCNQVIDTITVNASTPFTLITSSVDATCQGDCDGEGTASVTGGNSPFTYQWDAGTGNQTTQTATSLCEGTYYITVTDSSGCSFVDSITITANPIPPAPTALGGTYCPGSPVVGIYASGTGGTITWYYDSTLNNVINTDSMLQYGFASSNDTVWVTQTQGGCESEPVPVIINVFPGPNAQIDADPSFGQIPLNVQFENNTTGGTPPYSWEWDFGNGNSSTDFEPDQTYDSDGTYTVTLTVTDNNGCKSTVTLTIIADLISSLVVPNVFTPNGDGLNDYFNIQTEGIIEFEAVIFNRWGLKLYEWYNHPVDAWDGGDHPDGTYYYIISAKGADNRIYEHTGYITVIRGK